MHGFKKNDIVCDYHGKVTPNTNSKKYCDDNPDVDSTYVMGVTNPPKRVIDASSEICPVHPDSRTRCLGRLINHATEKIHQQACNLTARQIELSTFRGTEWHHVAVLVARRDIQPLEQLRYDYGDERARRELTG